MTRTILDAVARHARERPEAVALHGTGEPVRWSELRSRIDGVASAVLDQVAPGSRVCVLGEHDTALVVTVLGVQRAGCVAVVLNPTDPDAHRAAVRASVEAALVLEGEPPPSAAPGPLPEVAGDDLAFVIHTSGTSGAPKGVVQTHANVLHNVTGQARWLGLGPAERVVVLAGLSGGQGVATANSALLAGAETHLFPVARRGITGLVAFVAERGITVWASSTSVFRHVVRTVELGGESVSLRTVRNVRLASEQATGDDLRAARRLFGDDVTVHHTLSCSEAGNITRRTYGAGDAVPEGRLSVGWPADGVDVLLLDDRGEPVGHGQEGEVVVRSAYLSPGYWADPVRTAERFADDPEPGVRRFRTRDRAWMAADGSLTVLGRSDTAVKVRGQLVDLEATEQVLTRHPGVAASVVVARPGVSADDVVLAAHVVAAGGEEVTATELRRAMTEVLPAAAVPSTFTFHDRLPLSAHGKVDRRRLAALAAVTSGTRRTTRTDEEDFVANAWSDAFAVDAVGPDDDFFGLGGDSLIAAVIAARLHAATGIDLDLSAFAANPTVAAMADDLALRLADPGPGGERPPLLPAGDGDVPASSAQERIWRFSQTPETQAGWRMTVRWRLVGQLDVELLRAALDHVVARQVALRTTFHLVDGALVQREHPPWTVALPVVDARADDDPEAVVARTVRTEGDRPFALDELPLVRFVLVRTGDNEHHLLRTSHHVIADGPAWRLLREEVDRFYRAAQLGAPAPSSAPSPIQYRDYAAWERANFAPGSPLRERQVAWWRANLAGVAALPSLPFSRAVPAPDAPPAAGTSRWDVDPVLVAALDRLGRELAATPFVLRLAVFSAVLADDLDVDELYLGTYASTRRRVELLDVFGLFANLVALRLRLPPAATGRQLVVGIRGAVADAWSRADLQHEELVAALDTVGERPPSIEAIFAISSPRPQASIGDLHVYDDDHALPTMPWGFSFQPTDVGEGEQCIVRFDARRYDPEGVERFALRYLRLAAAMAAGPDEPLGRLLAGV